MKFYFALVVFGLLSTGCAATPPPVPKPLPEPVHLEHPSVDPSGIDWDGSFISEGEGSKKLFEGGALGVVFPNKSEPALRIGVLSAVLKHGRQVHDLGCISDIPGLQFGESVGNDKLHLSLIDPTANWVASTVAGSLALEAVFRILALEVASTEILDPRSVERMVAYRAHLIGQVVSRSTGETICTVDVTQLFPIESSKAQIVRTLVEKLP